MQHELKWLQAPPSIRSEIKKGLTLLSILHFEENVTIYLKKTTMFF